MADLCTGGCGFFGNAAFGGMCSKCHKESGGGNAQQGSQGSQISAPQVTVTPASPTATSAPISIPARPRAASSASSSSSAEGGQSLGGPSPGFAAHMPSLSPGALSSLSTSPQKGATRCLACKKRIGLTGFRCRCGFYFCGAHRYSDKHGCTFDYKREGAEAIARDNPTVRADKIDKI